MRKYKVKQVNDKLIKKMWRGEFLNGFNNGRDKADGIGGNKPIDLIANDVTIHNVDNLAKFCKKIAKQEDCPPEFIDIVNKEFWNLI